MNESLYVKLYAIAKAHPEKTCLILENAQSLTYAQLFDQVHRIATVLTELNIVPDDRVVAHCEKTPLALALYLACLQLGAVYVPLNTAYTASELAYFLDDAEPKLYVGSQSSKEATVRAIHQHSIDSDGTGSLYDAVKTVREPMKRVATRTSDDVAAILYTSGTTGRSKGAMLTHGNLLSNAVTLNDIWGFHTDDVLLHALPIYHVHGLFVAIHCVLLSGSSMIFQQRFRVEAVHRSLRNATVLMGVPTFYTRLLAEAGFDKSSVENMRLFISGSAPLTEQTFREFASRTGMEILERYGMSETLMNTSNPLNGQRLAGTVGFPLPQVDVRIVGETGGELPVGEVGGIELKGPNVFKGYWRMSEKTADEFRSDGFFVTGDMGKVDAENRLTIVGREKDLVISGGLNVYPAEVESVIGDLEDVADVAVVGAPHPDFGEGVVAFIVSQSGKTIETGFLRDALKLELANFKLPKHVEMTDELPRNAMGKIQKNLLREQVKGVFG